MLICDTIKKRRRRGPRVVYVEKLSLSKCYQTVLRRPRKKGYKYFFKNALKFGKSVQKKVVKLYYREIERKRDLPADDRANSYSTFLLFIVLTFPGYGVSLYFSKFFVSAVRFRSSAFGKVLLVLPLARHFYTLYFSFQSPPIPFWGGCFWWFKREREKEKID